MNKTGVSVLICTYNGTLRLPDTLTHLAKQKVKDNVSWEILIIDNASTDNTPEIAKQLQTRYSQLTIRILSELKSGKIHALHTGILHSRYPYLIVCDDDNWLSENYVEAAYTHMENNPSIGLIGGVNEAAFEDDPPFWFHQYSTSFAVGQLHQQPTNVTDSYEIIWGAGMVLRKEAYEKLLSLGFSYLLTGGVGSKRGSGEDVELSWAVRLLGYQLWYMPSLRLKHFMPTKRLKWETLLEITKANGAASIYYNTYRYVYDQRRGVQNRIRTHWRSEFLANLRFLFNGRTWLKYFFQRKPGQPETIRIERQLAKLKALLHVRSNYDQSFIQVNKLIHHPHMNQS